MAIHEVFMPALSSTMTEGKIVSWQKSPGDKVEKGEIVVVVESDKADMDVETFYSGYIATIVIPAGESAPVGSAIALVAETQAEIEIAKQQAQGKSSAATATAPTTTSAPAATATATTIAPPATTATPAPATLRSERPVVSPRARKLAKEYGIAVETLNGTGPNGRITAEDVGAAAGKPQAAPAHSQPAAPVATPAYVPPAAPAIAAVAGTVVPFTTLQAAVTRNMMASLSVPTFRVGYTIETNNLDALYKQIKAKGVTMTALLAKAVAMTLAKHPTVNASYTDAGLNHPGSINIAVAVSMPDGGLITPVLQNADKLDLYSLSRMWKDLVDRARIKQLQPQEYSSGTFTISNLGMLGVDRFDAILPSGTGAILAVGASHPQVVASEDGTFAIRRQMQVNMTADHRIIYGADAANFLKDLALLIQTNAQSLTL
ncbi:dihydrolipoamide acetyltransferase family protein [Chamaesiphon polymorphus]|uniref:Dihydrolipoamide acetyltransferase component of pyruvate dehydrogenase complex n=1 Tax=Chamaesiphon polymorphus CCALA 037 TaxID=2107692 RepID=A0A2T1F8B2_9CYAN|nr:dihydrolipoamide acetyltransferase family protein [Chamaesiphon polymorphus]PSB41184.1 branched-chain alpha-keto acid dehydrogenase subunit E2 [Chamaesiphon polymorphus CCALA 037]